MINKFHICRKICKTCKCKPEEHDIKSAEEEAHKLVVHSLFSKDSPVAGIRDYFRKLEAANKTERSEYAKQFAWSPPGLQQGVVCISTAEQKIFSEVLVIGNQVEMKSLLATVNQLFFGSKSIGINCHFKSPHPPPQKKSNKTNTEQYDHVSNNDFYIQFHSLSPSNCFVWLTVLLGALSSTQQPHFYVAILLGSCFEGKLF